MGKAGGCGMLMQFAVSGPIRVSFFRKVKEL